MISKWGGPNCDCVVCKSCRAEVGIPEPQPIIYAKWKYRLGVSLLVIGLIGSLFFAAWGSV